MRCVLTIAPDSPKILPPRLENFPRELAALNQWVCWAIEDREGKHTKVPKRTTGANAAVDNPATWSSLESALAAYQRNPLNLRGVGFVVTRDDEFSVVDLDKCRAPDTGEIDDWAIDIAQELDSYTEVSPSGTGLRMIARGKIPVLLGKTGGKSHGGG